MKNKYEFFKTFSVITTISYLFSCYCINDIVTADETYSDFDPYVFYREILNEKRPTDAKGYRFLDLDGDKKEEMLIKGENNIIMALYSSNNISNRPINLYTQAPSAPSFYSVLSNGLVCYNPVRWRSGSYGSFYYRISNGTLQPVIGYYIWIEGPNKSFYKTTNEQFLSLPLNDDFSLWDNISNEVDSFNETTYNNYVNANNSIFQIDNEKTIVPWNESFISYDNQREFEKNNNASPLSINGHYGYDELIQKYKDVLSSPGLIQALDVSYGKTCLNTDMYSHLWKEYSYTKTGFELIDLNDDGIMELAVGCVENDGSFNIFDLYTITDDQIVHLAASGWRDRFSIGKDKEIVESGVSGAADGEVMAYSLINAKLKPIRVLSVEKGVYYYFYNFGTPFENKTEITREEYFEIEKNQFMRYNDHDVVLFNDWYPGMRINEDPNGDANNDGEINILDVFLVHNHILSMSGETVVNTEYADINKDNTVNVIDLMLIKRLLLT